MKRREFGGMLLLALASLTALSKATLAGTGNQTATKLAAVYTAVQPENAYYITITTFFPYAMPIKDYKNLVQGCRNIVESEKLINDMVVEGKLLSLKSRVYDDKVVNCIGFSDEQAFREYEERYHLIPGNSTKIKKQLGFTSKREFIKTVIS